MIKLENIKKIHKLGERGILVVLKEISFSIKEAEHISIMGPSGSGKTTLLSILGCLDKMTEGRYLLGGKDVSSLNDDELSQVRCKKIGFVFQNYNLIPQLTVLENIGLPLFYQNVEEKIIREKSRQLAELVGLEKRIYHRPPELSGGEQQKVAIARSLANDPIIILADEPTGNLDSKAGEEIMGLLLRLNKGGKTLVVVSHSPKVANYAKRIIHMLDGKITNED